MRLLQIVQLLQKNMIALIILGGIFVIILQPKVNMSFTKDTPPPTSTPNNKTTTNLFSDIPLDYDARKALDNSNTVVHVPMTQESDKNIQTYNEQYKHTTAIEDMQKHKDMIIAECIRREPDLNEWSKLNYSRKNIPTIPYVLQALEEQVGANYLYENVQRGVNLVMQYIGGDN